MGAMLPNKITKSMICAGGVKDEDSCMGDSGGPLTYKSGGQHILIGDVSWGSPKACGPQGQYGVYGRISHLRPWIEQEMDKLETPKYCETGPDADGSDSDSYDNIYL